MKNIVNWLRKVEYKANQLYLKAATEYENDLNFHTFLINTAEDEAWHYQVLGRAEEFLSSTPELISAISVDSQTSNKILGLIKFIEDGLDQKSLGREELIDKIVELELSEWNSIFVYAVNFLKERMCDFKYPAARIQAHVKEIEYFLEKTEGRPQSLKKIKALPPVWIEKILIVDDEPIITELLKSLLNPSGNIDIAHDGHEALKLMELNYYKLIISDLNMPIMDGITFYKEAVLKYPGISKRFLFLTGDVFPVKNTFFKENQVKFLAKPMNIGTLRNEAEKIIRSK